MTYQLFCLLPASALITGLLCQILVYDQLLRFLEERRKPIKFTLSRTLYVNMPGSASYRSLNREVRQSLANVGYRLPASQELTLRHSWETMEF